MIQCAIHSNSSFMPRNMMVNAKRQCFNQDMKNGIVYLLGAGPGDPGLITIRGKELISTADVLIYDALVSPEII
ncbi:MAG: SAM-dependent methyltransferase, partial [Akkermansia sp.]